MKLSINLTIEITAARNNLFSRVSWGRLRKLAKRRDGAICQYCGEASPDGHADHVVPLSRGGTDDMSNLVWSCSKCNLEKGAKTASEFNKTKDNDAYLEREETEVLRESEVIELLATDATDTAIARIVYGHGTTHYIEKVRRIKARLLTRELIVKNP